MSYKNLVNECNAGREHMTEERIQALRDRVMANKKAEEASDTVASKATRYGLPPVREVVEYHEQWEGRPDSIWTRDHLEAIFSFWLVGDREPLRVLELARGLGQRYTSTLFYLKQFDFQNGEGYTWNSQVVVREIFARGDPEKLAELNARWRTEYDKFNAREEA